jgi:hypothetical protein
MSHTGTSCMSNVGSLFAEKIKCQDSAFLCKTLFKRLATAFRLPTTTQKFLRKPPVILKIVPKAAYEMFILHLIGDEKRKSKNDHAIQMLCKF